MAARRQLGHGRTAISPAIARPLEVLNARQDEVAVVLGLRGPRATVEHPHDPCPTVTQTDRYAATRCSPTRAN